MTQWPRRTQWAGQWLTIGDWLTHWPRLTRQPDRRTVNWPRRRTARPMTNDPVDPACDGRPRPSIDPVLQWPRPVKTDSQLVADQARPDGRSPAQTLTQLNPDPDPAQLVRQLTNGQPNPTRTDMTWPSNCDCWLDPVDSCAHYWLSQLLIVIIDDQLVLDIVNWRTRTVVIVGEQPSWPVIVDWTVGPVDPVVIIIDDIGIDDQYYYYWTVGIVDIVIGGPSCWPRPNCVTHYLLMTQLLLAQTQWRLTQTREPDLIDPVNPLWTKADGRPSGQPYWYCYWADSWDPDGHWPNEGPMKEPSPVNYYWRLDGPSSQTVKLLTASSVAQASGLIDPAQWRWIEGRTVTVDWQARRTVETDWPANIVTSWWPNYYWQWTVIGRNPVTH